MNALQKKLMLIQAQRSAASSNTSAHVDTQTAMPGAGSHLVSEMGVGGGTAPGLPRQGNKAPPDIATSPPSKNTNFVKNPKEITESVKTKRPVQFERHAVIKQAVKEHLHQQQMNELKQRLSDKTWRLNNLYVIQDENGRVVPFRLRHEQREFLKNIHNRNFVPKARKLGMSTFLVIYSMDECIFPSQAMMDQDDEMQFVYLGMDQDGEPVYERRPVPEGERGIRSVRCGIIDLKETDAWEKLGIAKLAWDNGPRHPSQAIADLWKKLHIINPLVTESKGEMKWKNGSVFQAGVGYTGKTPQILHVSELGPIAAQKPKVAENIVRGSINAVPARGIVTVETTMEGGRIGECYNLYKLALSCVGSDLTHLDWKLHFFSWLRHPSYKLENREPQSQTTVKYFEELTRTHAVEFEVLYGWKNGVVPKERQAWWEKKRVEQKDHMWQQFPTVPEELDRSNVAGQIYPEMTRLRTEGRVKCFDVEPRLPLVISADLGSSQNSAYWLVQPTYMDTNFMRCSFGEGKGAMGLADIYRKWQKEFPDNEIIQVLLPHDARITDKGSGLTFEQNLVKAGVPRNIITVVSRTPDVWAGIESVQNGLPRCWFHKETDMEVVMENETGVTVKLPSGVTRLENYRRTPPTAKGVEQDTPFPDICSHAADAVRTYFEAKERHLVRSHAVSSSMSGITHRRDKRIGNPEYEQEDLYDRAPRRRTATLATET